MPSRREFLQAAATTALAGLYSPRAWAVDGGDAKELIVHTRTPMNAEPALPNLTSSWLTPVKYFYVRSHAPNPIVDPAEFRLRIEGMVERPLSLSLAELKGRFEKRQVTATMTCAGNRRSEHNAVRKVSGVQWKAGAVGNATWGGVTLASVLKAAGLTCDAKHVWFESLDKIEKSGRTFPFGASIPIEKALADANAMPGSLLSDEMNGQALPADHGFPLRVVVPGYIGARSVKWLGRIVVSNRPSPNHYVDHAYKLVADDSPLAWAESGPLYQYRLNSAISHPHPNVKAKSGTINVSGYALPPGDGSTVARVEVSTDGGRHWTTAKLTSESKPYCWTLWSAAVIVTSTTKHVICRATDSKGRTQPAKAPWNLKGYMFNSPYHVSVNS